MFEDIVGNETIKNLLIQSLNNNRILQSYMFIGISGIGKKKLANEFAKEIIKAKQKDNIPDLLNIEPDGNSIKIEQIREMQKKIQEKPIASDRKVFIIDDADKMTKEAQNCLLKTLEEPPQYATIILIGTNENSFLTTIKSRCMILRFNKLSDEEMKKYLNENMEITEVTQTMLDMYQGSIAKAITLKNKEKKYFEIENLVNQIAEKDLIDIVKQAEKLYKEKDDIYEILDYINILLLKKAKEDYRYTKCIQIVENTKKRLKQNGNYDMCIDGMLFNIYDELA